MGPTRGYGGHVGRVGALAVALGIGSAMFVGAGTALAEESGTSAAAGSGAAADNTSGTESSGAAASSGSAAEPSAPSPTATTWMVPTSPRSTTRVARAAAPTASAVKAVDADKNGVVNAADFELMAKLARINAAAHTESWVTRFGSLPVVATSFAAGVVATVAITRWFGL